MIHFHFNVQYFFEIMTFPRDVWATSLRCCLNLQKTNKSKTKQTAATNIKHIGVCARKRNKTRLNRCYFEVMPRRFNNSQRLESNLGPVSRKSRNFSAEKTVFVSSKRRCSVSRNFAVILRTFRPPPEFFRLF